MDDLDAAKQWLAGYLAGRDGMAPEAYLLKAGEEAGHNRDTLWDARGALGIICRELAPATKWSRWWWLPDASYSNDEAKAAGITNYRMWPYGPNIDLWSRTRLVSWATAHQLKVARHGAPLCLPWLEQGRCRGCDRRGSGHIEFRLDHVSGWMRNGQPAVIVNHPYHLSSRDFAYLARAVEQHPGLEVSMPGGGWYGRSTIQIEVWNKTARSISADN